jgi:rod shape determining protein RodA
LAFCVGATIIFGRLARVARRGGEIPYCPRFLLRAAKYFFLPSARRALPLASGSGRQYHPHAMMELLSQLLSGRMLVARGLTVLAALLLISIGLATLYAAGHPLGVGSDDQSREVGKIAGYFDRQIVFAAVAIFAMVLASSFSYRLLGPLSYILYGLILVMLAILLVARVTHGVPFATPRNGAYCWFSFGGLQVQPSEFCKLAYIVALAWYLRYRTNCRNFSALVGPFIFALAPMVMILLEPDLGTVMLMMPILFAMLFVAGAKGRHLVLIVLLAGACTPVFWHFMSGYQRMRVSSMLLQSDWLREKARSNPTLGNILAGGSSRIRNWERNEGYQLQQSKYAIASGGLTGYGWRNGPYLKYDLLPERHNDFVFSLVAHQWGFVGCMVLLLLYAMIVVCGISIAVSNTDPFGRLIAVGIVTMFAVEILVNISMAVGLMPITGITLPLISYGGSSLLIHTAALGLLNNIGRSKPFNVAGSPFKYGNEPEML